MGGSDARGEDGSCPWRRPGDMEHRAATEAGTAGRAARVEQRQEGSSVDIAEQVAAALGKEARWDPGACEAGAGPARSEGCVEASGRSHGCCTSPEEDACEACLLGRFGGGTAEAPGGGRKGEEEVRGLAGADPGSAVPRPHARDSGEERASACVEVRRGLAEGAAPSRACHAHDPVAHVDVPVPGVQRALPDVSPRLRAAREAGPAPVEQRGGGRGALQRGGGVLERAAALRGRAGRDREAVHRDVFVLPQGHGCAGAADERCRGGGGACAEAVLPEQHGSRLEFPAAAGELVPPGDGHRGLPRGTGLHAGEFLHGAEDDDAHLQEEHDLVPAGDRCLLRSDGCPEAVPCGRPGELHARARGRRREPREAGEALEGGVRGGPSAFHAGRGWPSGLPRDRDGCTRQW